MFVDLQSVGFPWISYSDSVGFTSATRGHCLHQPDRGGAHLTRERQHDDTTKCHTCQAEGESRRQSIRCTVPGKIFKGSAARKGA